MTLYLENKLFTNRKLKNQPDSYKSNEKISIRKNITEFVLTSADRAKLLGLLKWMTGHTVQTIWKILLSFG